MYHNPATHFTPADEPNDKPQRIAKPDFSYDRKLGFLSAVIRHPKMTMAGVRAADVILDMHNHKLGYCWPSLDTMAERMGMSRSTVKAAVTLLIETGFIVKEAVRHGGHQGSNRYRPTLIEGNARGRNSDLSPQPRGQNPDPQRSVYRPARGQFTGPPEVSPSPPNQNDRTKSINQIEKNQLATSEAGFSIDGEKPDVVAQSPKVPLPDDLAFTPEAIAAARAHELDDEDIAAAMSAFREINRDDRRTLARWISGAAGFLAIQRPRPKGTAAIIVPDRPVDPNDADGTAFPGRFPLNDESQAFAARVPEAVLKMGHAAFMEHFQSAPNARSRDWNATWRSWIQYAWDFEKASKAKPKFQPARPAI